MVDLLEDALSEFGICCRVVRGPRTIRDALKLQSMSPGRTKPVRGFSKSEGFGGMVEEGGNGGKRFLKKWRIQIRCD